MPKQSLRSTLNNLINLTVSTGTSIKGDLKDFRFANALLVTVYQNNRTFEQKSIGMINEMNTRRPHNDSAEFGLTEYSDMSHDEFAAMKLNGNLTNMNFNQQKNIIVKDGDDRTWKNLLPHNIIRYERDVFGNIDRLPKRIDW